MSPPAAWKRRLRCGLVGSWVLMRSDGVRSAMAGVSITASSFAAMLAAIARIGPPRLQRSWRLPLHDTGCYGMLYRLAAWRCKASCLDWTSMLHAARCDLCEALQLSVNSPSERLRRCRRVAPHRSSISNSRKRPLRTCDLQPCSTESQSSPARADASEPRSLDTPSPH